MRPSGPSWTLALVYLVAVLVMLGTVLVVTMGCINICGGAHFPVCSIFCPAGGFAMFFGEWTIWENFLHYNILDWLGEGHYAHQRLD